MTSFSSNRLRGVRGRAEQQLAIMAVGLVGLIALACGTDAAESPATDGSKPTTSPPPTTQPVAISPPAVATGDAPAFTGETFNHGTFSLDGVAGKPVVVNFWFPSCPPCRAEMPDLQAAYEKYSPQGVEFVGIEQLGLDNVQDGKDFVEEVGVTYPVFADESSRIQTAYRVLSFPTTVFLDRDHNIKRTWTGLLDTETLDEQIQLLLNS